MFCYTDDEIHEVRDELLEWMRASDKREFTVEEVFESVDHSYPLISKAITQLVLTLRITDTADGYRLLGGQ